MNNKVEIPRASWTLTIAYAAITEIWTGRGNAFRREGRKEAAKRPVVERYVKWAWLVLCCVSKCM